MSGPSESSEHQGSGLAWREAGPPDGDPVLLVHGYPESSYMWRDVLPALGDAGWRAVAPDLAGFGDSPADPSGTWERHTERLEEFRDQLDIDTCVLVVHDWGGLIGLRWACDNAGAATALVISSSGFFPDGRWHGLAETLRTAGEGEKLMADLTRGAFAELLDHSSVGIDESAVDEYWKAFSDERRREAQLELYRSGDFEKLAPYEGALADLDVPVLLVWGDRDEFSPVAGAHRLARELPGAELAVIEDAGHFVWEDEPGRTVDALLDFLGRL